MSNAAGSEAALPGAAKSSPDAHVSTRNTAFRTESLLTRKNAPLYGLAPPLLTSPPDIIAYRPWRNLMERSSYGLEALPCLPGSRETQFRQNVCVVSAAKTYQPCALLGVGAKALLGWSFDIGVAGAVPPDRHAKPVMQRRQQGFRPFRTRLKRAADGHLTQRPIADIDFQCGVAHQLTGHITQRRVLEIQTIASPSQQAGELRRVELADHLGAPLYCHLLTCRHGRWRHGNCIRWREVIRRRTDHVDRAFTDRHFRPGGPQIDIERRTNCAH